MIFFDPWSAARGKGYQTVQAFLALGRGGIAGTGPAASRQKLFFLPAPHTDFILAVIGEELGFIGLLLVVALFGIILWRGMRVALRAPDLFGTYLAFGLTFSLFLQAVINIMVVAGLMPTKGLTLPFISYGGTSLVASLAAVGVLLNISQHGVSPRVD
jgi:cell division protein FtsW